MSGVGVSPWDIVRVQPFDGGGFVDASTGLNSNASIQIFVDETGQQQTARLMKNTDGQKMLLHNYMPSLYTGGMRKLMQVSHLRGVQYFSSFGHDAFLPDFNDTWGVFISPASGGFCARWIIRISDQGIFRYQITFSKPLPDNWPSLEATAAGQSSEDSAQLVGRLWSAGKFDITQGVQIGSAPALYSTHLGLGTLAAQANDVFGWAFNSDGSSAVVTAIKDDPANTARLYCDLFRVDISHTSGTPTSASVTLLEGGKLVNPFNDSGDANEWAMLQVGDRGYIKTLPCWPGAGNHGVANQCPVFAFYDSSDALHVVRWDYDYVDTSVNETNGNATSALNTYSDTATDVGTVTRCSLGTWGSRNGVAHQGSNFVGAGIPVHPGTFIGTKIDGSYELSSVSWTGVESVNLRPTAYGTSWFTIKFKYIVNNIIEPDYGQYREFMLQAPGGAYCDGSPYNEKEISYTQSEAWFQTLILPGTDRTIYGVATAHHLLKTDQQMDSYPSGGALRIDSEFKCKAQDTGGGYMMNCATGFTFDQEITQGENLDHYASGSCLPGTSGGSQEVLHVGTYCNAAGGVAYTANTIGDLSATSYPGNSDESQNTFHVFLSGALQQKAMTNFSALMRPHVTSAIELHAAMSLIPGSRYYLSQDVNAKPVTYGFNYGPTVNDIYAFVGWF